MIVVNHRISIPKSETKLSFARSGGPGGQNVNKVNSKATLRWPVTTSPSLPEEVRARFLTKFANRITTEGDLVIASEKSRDQPSNIEDCYDKLREMILSVATTPRKRKPTKPTKGSQKRRLEAKKGRSQTKQMRGKVKREE